MKTTSIAPHKSSLGMEANITVLVIYIAMAALSWIYGIKYFAWAVPVVFFFLEKESKFVKFQAVQALIIGLVQAALSALFSIIIWALTPRYRDFYDIWNNYNRNAGLIGFVGIVAIVVGIAITVVLVYLLYTAYNYKQVELPVIGPIAEKAGKKLDSVNINQPVTGEPEKPADDGPNENQASGGNTFE